MQMVKQSAFRGNSPGEGAGGYNQGVPRTVVTLHRPYACQKALQVRMTSLSRGVMRGLAVKWLPECASVPSEFWAGPGRLIHTVLAEAWVSCQGVHWGALTCCIPASASETVTSGSRKGAGSHGGNNINYQSCFGSLGLPVAWHIH